MHVYVCVCVKLTALTQPWTAQVHDMVVTVVVVSLLFCLCMCICVFRKGCKKRSHASWCGWFVVSVDVRRRRQGEAAVP